MINQNKQIYNKEKFKPSPLISPILGISDKKILYSQKNENSNTYNKEPTATKNIENDIIVSKQITNNKKVINNQETQPKQNTKITNNKIIFHEKTLIITKEKIILPFTTKQVETIFKSYPDKYTNLNQIIDSKFTLSTILYKKIILSKIIEVYKLMRVKNKYSLHKTFSICIEVIFNTYIFPAIITACKNLDELEIYLDCLEKNELNQYPCFKIIYNC